MLLRLPTPALPRFFCLGTSGSVLEQPRVAGGAARESAVLAVIKPPVDLPAGERRPPGWRCSLRHGDRVFMAPFLPEQTQIAVCLVLVLSPVFLSP